MGAPQDRSGGLSSKCVAAILANAKAQAELSRARAACQAARKAVDAAQAALEEDSHNWVDPTLCVIEAMTPWGAAACLTQSVRTSDDLLKAERDAENDLDVAAGTLEQVERDADAAESRVRHDCERSDAGCGSRGGRGCRRPDGKCAGWDDWAYQESDEAYV